MISCRKLAQKIKDEVKSEIESLNLEEDDKKPYLFIIDSGSPDGQRYIRNKEKVAKEVGIGTFVVPLRPEMKTERFEDLNCLMQSFPSGSGVILQLPFTGDKNKDQELINNIPVYQDVDGLREDSFVTPATALGIYEYLKENDLINGKRITIIGRSKLVGMPLAKMLLNTDATVTLCHSKTEDLQLHTLEADVIVCAVGKINFITRYHLWEDKDYHIIDVGINFDEGILCGDVADEVHAMDNVTCTPVPGGVGLLTTACLMKNTLTLYKKWIDDVTG